MKKGSPILRYLVAAIIITTFGACSDFVSSPPNVNGSDFDTFRSSTNRAPGDSKFITSDAAAFAKKLKALDNENEVLIVLKATSAPRISKITLKQLPIGNQVVIALPEAKTNAVRRSKPGFARVNAQSRQSIKAILTAHNIKNVVIPDFGHVIDVELPTEKAIPVLVALLNSPSVDYIEANQLYPVHFDSYSIPSFLPLSLTFKSPSRANLSLIFANPEGSNPADDKHTYHDVLDAWDYTRGSGARVGILDSGFAFDQGTNSYHPDGQLITNNKGIKKLGFVDDYGSDDPAGDNCDGGTGQPYGDCLEWDDDSESTYGGHGTFMTGLVGENDNNMGYVGVMPEGLTISMKAVQNCYLTGGCPDAANTTYYLESDDYAAAVEWAIYNNIDVLSMSFSSTGMSSTVYNALYDAYHQGDVLLLSSTGNTGDDPDLDYPQNLDFVMGVGGVQLDGSNYGKDQYQDISALWFGATVDSYCPNASSFCQPNGYENRVYGTSTSTAVVAGIAGLVRAYNPSLTASQVRQRLINTSTGPHNTVNAVRAVLNDIPLTVSITGPSYIDNSGSYTWEAMPEGGNTGYNYVWEYREDGFGNPWQTVGTNKTYTRFVARRSQMYQFTLRVTVTSGSEQDSATKFITVTQEGCPPNQICPQ